MSYKNKGRIYLVGAGPGDPDLLTLKAYRLLKSCDILVYDSLVSNELLDLVPHSCRRFFVGKRHGSHSLTQLQINTLLVDLADDNLSVVRLKGGDPFIFGRGAEEAEYLVCNNIKVEVVPGITSGIAVPAYFGIPLTHRGIASSVTFVTGHQKSDQLEQSVNWRALAKSSDGIVVYMGINNLSYIFDELILGGIDTNTPVAIINHGTLIGQRCIKFTINDINEKNIYLDLVTPAIVIIGNVVNCQVKGCSPIITNFKNHKKDEFYQAIEFSN